MSHLILILAIYSLFSMHIHYAGQSKIEIFIPYCNTSRVPDAEKLKNNARQKLEDILVKTYQKPGLVNVHSFNIKYEPRGTPEIYDHLVRGAGIFINDAQVREMSMMGALLGLDHDFHVYLLGSRNSYYKLCGSQKPNEQQCKTEYWYDRMYLTQAIENYHLLVYIIGTDTPVEHPLHKDKMDAEWHIKQIDFLKEKCRSVVVLIAQERYAEMGTILSQRFSTKNDKDETITRSTKSYRPLIIFSILGLAAVLWGIFYKYSKNGSISNSSLFSAKEICP